MAVTETTTIGWGSRLGSSFKGILVGLLLFVAGFPLLFWNEGRAVADTKTNEEGAASVVEATAAEIDPAQEGMLVHVVGEATTKDVLSDGEYGVSATAIRLSRTVEMYQWVESSHTHDEKKLGGKIERTTTYTCEKAWRTSAVSSDSFHGENRDKYINPPARRELGTKVQYAKDVKVGARSLNESQIQSVGGEKPLAVKYQRVGSAGFSDGDAPDPKVGDIRVTFSSVAPHVVTIVAVQCGQGFRPYTAKSTKKQISDLRDGDFTAEEVFLAREKGNRILTWILRLAGFLCMFFGVKAVLAPLVVLADVVPFIGSIANFGTGLVAFVVAAPCALVTIAIAWIFYRPVIGVTLIIAAVAIVFFVLRKRAAAKAAAPAAPTAA